MKRILGLCLAALALSAGVAQAATFPSPQGGIFEVTCKPLAIPDQAIDPIVNPGAVSAHVHTFFGNRALNSTSTPAQLQASASTTCVLAQDTAAYWVPQALRLDTGAIVTPTKVFAYYFGQAGVTPGQFPANLSMIGGNSHATIPDTTKQTISFSCGNGGSHHSPVRYYPYDCTAANGVSGSDGVVAIVKFPYCLSPDGSVGYGDPSTGLCAAGTTPLGQVQTHVHYGSGTAGFQAGSQLSYSSGPYYTLHADWMNGWQQAKLQSLVSGCLALHKDCGFVTNGSPGP